MKQDGLKNGRIENSIARKEAVMKDQGCRSKDEVAMVIPPHNLNRNDRPNVFRRSNNWLKSVFTEQRGGAVMKTRTCFAVVVMIVAVGYGTFSVAQTEFTFFPSNPILTDGSWDEGGPVWFPSVACQDSQYHMFYTGPLTPTTAIGYAVSKNGLSFIKHASAPVFEADGTGFDSCSVTAPSVLVEGDSLILFYGGDRSPSGKICIMPRAIGRAVAQSPTGPWERSEEPVLTTGEPGEWDCAFVYPNSVIATDTGYVMYYTGGNSKTDYQIGVATSPDGIHWKKHGEPVLKLGEAGSWDAGAVSRAAVVKNAGGWGMYYTGTVDDARQQIGYATSDDGLDWIKHPDNPILGADESWAAEKVFTGSAILNNDATACLLYYAGGASKDTLHIGVATGPFNRADCNEDERVDILDLMVLAQAALGKISISPWLCDCNGDGREGLRVLDILCIFNEYILGKTCQVSEGKVVVSPSEAMEFEEVLRPYLSAEDLAELMALVKPEEQVPVANSLAPNYPNPFNPVTSIGYTLAEASSVKLEVYNVLGQVVAVLADDFQNAGAHQVEWDGSDVASGYYFYRLTAGNFTATRRMMLMK